MKYIVGIGLIVVGVGFGVFMIVQAVVANYHYNNSIAASWSLAEKASTIAQKSEYIDKFVSSLQNAKLVGVNDALYFPTPDNSFDENFKALESLQGRLHEIQKMDESSFAYQAAIQQITAQEQGEAGKMLDIFFGSWMKVNYYYLWNGWLAFLWFLIGLSSPALGMVVLNTD